MLSADQSCLLKSRYFTEAPLKEYCTVERVLYGFKTKSSKDIALLNKTVSSGLTSAWLPDSRVASSKVAAHSSFMVWHLSHGD